MTKRQVEVVGTVALALIAVIAAGIVALSLNAAPVKAGLEKSLLQLDDMRPGYRLGDDTGCGAITNEGRPAGLSDVLGTNYPDFCLNQIERFDGLQPEVVQSAAVELSSNDLADEVMDVVPALGRYLTGAPENAVPEPFDYGEEAALVPFTDGNGAPHLLLAWRDGTRVYLIDQQGDTAPDNLTNILLLAGKQQNRAINVTPVIDSEPQSP